MSGGVDSAVTAWLLKEAGHDVIGVTLRTWEADDGEQGRCCEIDDARRVAFSLGIPFYPVGCLQQFEQKVIVPFMDAYMKGMTPNPCIICNPLVKWERLMHMARVLGADAVATGHYASVVQLKNGRFTVKKATHAAKDQTYMLYRLTQEQLAHTQMPLGGMSKDEVRQIAEREGLSVAHKPDSQEICFVTEGKYTDFIEQHSGAAVPGEGNFVDKEGRVLGRHKGIIHYTPGQRRGLGLALGFPAYVVRILPETNEVLVGTESDLYQQELICTDPSFMSIAGMEAGESLSCRVKIRYQHPAQEAVLQMQEDHRLKILFSRPVRAASPGQAAVFYDEDDCVIGGGMIIGTDA